MARKGINITMGRDYTLTNMEVVLTYKSNWWGFIGRRVFIYIIAFFVITMLIFFFIHITVDEYYLVYGFGYINWSPEAIENWQEIWEQAREVYHFNEPLMLQYFRWIGSFFIGD